MTTQDASHARLQAVRRQGARVRPLELFFDLVFVLALTQCTAIMAADPTWSGLGKGLLAVALLWWTWTGYAWLTSAVDPEEGAVRLAIFGAMAALLVVALALPGAFGELGVTFAVGYGVVRAAHIALFVLASRDDEHLRRSVAGLAIGTAIGVALLVGGAFLDGGARVAVWSVALALDMAGPFFFGSEGWQFVPGHFAERHALIVIVALGESIVAIGVGAEAGVTAGVVVAAVVGMALAAAMWWTYFDVVELVATRNLAETAEGRERNELARDSYSYLHLPMIAGIILVALGMKTTLAHVDDPLDTVPAFALGGGLALYLFAHVAFRLRNVRSVNWQRLVLAAVLLCLLPVLREVTALAAIAVVTALLCVVIAYEVVRFSEARDHIRHAPDRE